jgi:hypothetical protein
LLVMLVTSVSSTADWIGSTICHVPAAALAAEPPSTPAFAPLAAVPPAFFSVVRSPDDPVSRSSSIFAASSESPNTFWRFSLPPAPSAPPPSAVADEGSRFISTK